jgi:hypothetical protein
LVLKSTIQELLSGKKQLENNGDYAKSIIATSDGNYIIGGDSSSNISGDKTEKRLIITDVWLLK